MMHGSKRVENRTWKPSSKHYGQRIAIHAGSNAGHRDVQSYVRSRYKQAPKDKWPSGIVGTVKLLGVVHKDPVTGRVSYEGANTLSARMKVSAAKRSPYFHGPYAWVLDDPRPLQVPVAHEGKLNLWEPDKWAHSEGHERPPAALMRASIGKVASHMNVSGSARALAG